MSRLARPLLLPLALAAAVHAAPALQQAPLVTAGEGPYYTLQVPLAVQSRAASPALADLQLLNARGEPLPWAWVDASAAPAGLEALTLRPFALPGPASGAATLPSRSWLIDARAARGRLLHLELALDAQAQGAFTLQVETSSDLQQWRTLDEAAPVLALARDGVRLQRTGIDLGGAPPGYLRLTAAPGSLLPPLQSVQLTSALALAAPQPVQWSEPLTPQSCDERGCDFVLPAHVPLDQVELLPTEANTVAQVRWAVDAEPPARGDDARRRHDLHHPLHALRHKGDLTPAPTAPAALRTLATASVFWLQTGQGESRSGPTWLGAGVHPVLHLEVVGSLSLLGRTPPRIRVGTRTRTLVFLARGPAPYRLAWGGDPASPAPASAAAVGPLALEQLMPTRRAGDPLPPYALVVLDAARAAPLMASAAASRGAAVAAGHGAGATAQPTWLWAVLVAGVLAMGLMARSLLRKGPAA